MAPRQSIDERLEPLITHLILENFKSFRERQEIELGPLTLIYGPNGGGKSALIQALLLLEQSVIDRPPESDAALVTVGGGRISVPFDSLVHGKPEAGSFRIGWRTDASDGAGIEIKLRSRSQEVGAANADNEIEELVYSSPRFGVMDLSFAGRIRLKGDDPRTNVAGNLATPFYQLCAEASVASVEAVLAGINYSEEQYGRPAYLSGKGVLPSSLWYRSQDGDSKKLEFMDKWEIFAEWTRLLLRDSLASMGWVPAFREMPPEAPWVSLSHGRYRWWSDVNLDPLNRRLAGLGFPYELFYWRKPLPNGTSARQIFIKDLKSQLDVSLRDVGFGIGQVIPMLAMLDQEFGMICVEEPEIHLHPRAQACLADILLQDLENNSRRRANLDPMQDEDEIEWSFDPYRVGPMYGVGSPQSIGQRRQWIVETHSELMIRRIQRRIRNGETGLPAPAVVVLYVEPTANGALVHRIPLADDGEFECPWPGGFFADTMDDMLA